MTECSECGQTVPETATVDYVTGLLLPPLAVFVLAYAAFQRGFVDPRLFYTLTGALVMGTVVMIQTDPHIKQWYENCDWL